MILLALAIVFIVVIAALIVDIVYVNRGKKLKKRVAVVQEKLLVAGNASARRELDSRLKEASKKRDAEGFFAALEETEAHCDSELSGLPYKSVKEAKSVINEIVSRAVMLDGAAAGKEVRKQLDQLFANRDHARLLAIKSEYDAKFAEYKKQVVAMRKKRALHTKPNTKGRANSTDCLSRRSVGIYFALS